MADERVSIDGRFPTHDQIFSSLLFGVHNNDSTHAEVIDDTIRIVAVDTTYTFKSEKDTVEIEIIADADSHEIRRLTVTPRLSGVSSSACTDTTSDTVATTDGGLIVADDDGEILIESNEERPDDCQCTLAMGDLPCWPCYQEDFETPDSTAN